MSARWDRAINPATFQPILRLKIRNSFGVTSYVHEAELPYEYFQDHKLSKTDVLLKLFEIERMNEFHIANAYYELTKMFPTLP